jgi:sulfoxide reductase heme-binding subunit YedZ
MLESVSRTTAPERRLALKRDLVAAVPDATVALVVTGIVFGVLVLRVRAGTDAALVEMPQMAAGYGIWYYTLAQAFGFGALLWAWVTLFLGLLLAGERPRRLPLRYEQIEKLHRTTSLTVIALTFAHAVLFVQDQMADNFVGEFVPWAQPYVPGRFPTTLGIASFYLMLVLGLTFYLRDRLGRRTWRLAHRVVLVVYALAVWHTFIYGSDLIARGPLRWSLWAMQVPVALALLWRLLVPARRVERVPMRLHEIQDRFSAWLGLRVAGRMVVAAGVVGLLGMLLTGAIGGKP